MNQLSEEGVRAIYIGMRNRGQHYIASLEHGVEFIDDWLKRNLEEIKSPRQFPDEGSEVSKVSSVRVK